MRRALLAVIAGSTLLAGAACDSDAKSTEADTAAPRAATAAPTTAAPDYSVSTKQVCTKLDSLYATELKAFGTAMGMLVTYKENKQATDAEKAETTAAAHLKAAATKIRKETATAEDPDFQTAGKLSAAKLESSAKDHKYIDRVRTLKDLNTTVQSQFTEWLTPVSGYCTS